MGRASRTCLWVGVDFILLLKWKCVCSEWQAGEGNIKKHAFCLDLALTHHLSNSNPCSWNFTAASSCSLHRSVGPDCEKVSYKLGWRKTVSVWQLVSGPKSWHQDRVQRLKGLLLEAHAQASGSAGGAAGAHGTERKRLRWRHRWAETQVDPQRCLSRGRSEGRQHGSGAQKWHWLWEQWGETYVTLFCRRYHGVERKRSSSEWRADRST